MSFKEYNQYQTRFVVKDYRQNIPDDHICFLVDKIVESLDFTVIDRRYKGVMGASAYKRKLLLKIDLMGSIDGIFASRRVCEQTKYNDVYKFLSGGHTPDFHTLCISRHENDDLYRQACVKLVLIGKKLGIVTLKHVAVDGSPIKANASNSKLFTKQDMGYIDEIVVKRFEMDKDDELVYNFRNKEIIEKDVDDSIRGIIAHDILDSNFDEIIKEYNDSIKEQIGNNDVIIDNDKVVEKCESFIDKEVTGEKSKKISKKVTKVAKKLLNGDKNTIKKVELVNKKFDENHQDKINMTDPDSYFGKSKNGSYQSLHNVIFACDYDSNFIISSNIADSPVDSNQLTPMIDILEKTYGLNDDTVVSADAMFNNQNSLNYLEDNDIDALIPHKVESAISKNEEYAETHCFNKYFFKYDFENDCYICPNDEELVFIKEYEDGKRIYSTNKCETCMHKLECCPKKKNRIITVYGSDKSTQIMKDKMVLDEYQKEYLKRGATVEHPFSDIKYNNRFIEFYTRGTPKVAVEVNKLEFSHNLRSIIKFLKKLKINYRDIGKIADKIHL